MCRYHVQGRQVITVVVRLGVAALIALVLGHRRGDDGAGGVLAWLMRPRPRLLAARGGAQL